jgi:hypothetical protein
VYCVYAQSGPNCLNPEQFVKWMQDNHIYKNQPIMLWGCSAGQGDNSFAQRLSNRLGGRVVVAASNHTVWNPLRGFVSIQDGGVWRRFGGQR